MPEILTLLSCLTFDLNSTSLKHLGVIIQAMERYDWSGNNAGDIAPLREKEEAIEPFKDFFPAPRIGQR